MFANRKILKILNDSDLSLVERRIALIHNTAKYYSHNPNKRRAVDKNHQCVYRTENGKKACAIGRLLPDSTIETLRQYGSIKDSYNAIAHAAKVQIPQYVQDLETEDDIFLCDLQYLHDTEKYWCDSGLSVEGKKEVEELVKKYS